MASLLLGSLPIPSLAPNLSLSESETLSLSNSKCPNSISLSATSPTPPLIYCGRGDRKTAKGKRFAHSFGNARPRDKKKGRGPPKPRVPPSQPKKDRFDDD